MAQSSISVRIDAQDKKNFEMFCDQTGLNTTTAINLFIKTVIRQQCIPFRIAADPFESPANQERIKRNIALMESGKASVHE